MRYGTFSWRVSLSLRFCTRPVCPSETSPNLRRETDAWHPLLFARARCGPGLATSDRSLGLPQILDLSRNQFLASGAKGLADLFSAYTPSTCPSSHAPNGSPSGTTQRPLPLTELDLSDANLCGIALPGAMAHTHDCAVSLLTVRLCKRLSASHPVPSTLSQACHLRNAASHGDAGASRLTGHPARCCFQATLNDRGICRPVHHHVPAHLASPPPDPPLSDPWHPLACSSGSTERGESADSQSCG